MPDLRFLFDQHLSVPALMRLRDDGVDIVDTYEVGLSEADDPEILAWAVKEERIVVTRNYRDFGPLVEAYEKQGIPFPGVLFYARSVRQSDGGHHVRALRHWINHAAEAGCNPVQNAFGWLR